jgi:hypothetical protein
VRIAAIALTQPKPLLSGVLVVPFNADQLARTKPAKIKRNYGHLFFAGLTNPVIAGSQAAFFHEAQIIGVIGFSRHRNKPKAVDWTAILRQLYGRRFSSEFFYWHVFS